MIGLTIRHSAPLQAHLEGFQVDGATVQSVLFPDGRLMYPRRVEVERDLMAQDPYQIWHESRVVEGFALSVRASIRLLSAEATERLADGDQTLELLWRSHAAFAADSDEGPSFDRIVAALVMVRELVDTSAPSSDLSEAAAVFIRGLYLMGFPPHRVSMEELWDGAAPACVGLNLVSLE